MVRKTRGVRGLQTTLYSGVVYMSSKVFQETEENEDATHTSTEALLSFSFLQAPIPLTPPGTLLVLLLFFLSHSDRWAWSFDDKIFGPDFPSDRITAPSPLLCYQDWQMCPHTIGCKIPRQLLPLHAAGQVARPRTAHTCQSATCRTF